MMSNDGRNELSLPLDERNLSHVLSAIALAALTARASGAQMPDATCWWNEREFVLTTAFTESSLFDAADAFVRSLRWIPGFGGKEQGTFVAGTELGSNPFISLADGGQENSPFKTFAANQNPAEHLLDPQRKSLKAPDETSSWLFQMEAGISSWGLDSRVGSHAYDQGFSSNEEGSGDLDPIYPAIELLSIAAASFFTAVQAWQSDRTTVWYTVWTQPISVSMVSYAVAGHLGGIQARRYRVNNRAAAYGKGGAFRFFPEAMLQSQKGNQTWT
jgi:hypothetical protein